MKKIAARPYPVDLSTGAYTKRALGIGLFVFLFLTIFQPFGLAELHGKLIPVTLGFGGISFGITLFIGWIIVRIATEKSAENWNVGKEIAVHLLHLFIIGLGNVLWANATGMTNLDTQSIVIFQLFTLAVGLFPVTTVIIFREARQNRVYGKNAENINLALQEKSKTSGSGDKRYLLLPSQNKDEDLQIREENLVFIKAADNYVEVWLLKDGQLQMSLLRNSLKNIAMELRQAETFFRCHKSYGVNRTHITHVSGNAQGFRLHLSHTSTAIPVSRAHNDQIRLLSNNWV